MFIADLRQRRVHEDNPKYKPGRQVVTFLLITNLALWITYNFEIQKVNSHTQGDQFYPDNLYCVCIYDNIMDKCYNSLFNFDSGKRYPRSERILWVLSMGGDTADHFTSLCFLSVSFNSSIGWAVEKLLSNKETQKRRFLNTKNYKFIYLIFTRLHYITLSENRSSICHYRPIYFQSFLFLFYIIILGVY